MLCRKGGRREREGEDERRARAREREAERGEGKWLNIPVCVFIPVCDRCRW